MQLSKLRALSVEKQLREYGVPSRCFIQTDGFGESRPVADNNTAEGRAANRRVDLLISADEEEAERNQAEREKYRKN
jgi:OOP family OmpA-OmpF porin